MGAAQQVGHPDEHGAVEEFRVIDHLVEDRDARASGRQIARGDVTHHFKTAGLEGKQITKLTQLQIGSELKVAFAVVVVLLNLGDALFIQPAHTVSHDDVIVVFVVGGEQRDVDVAVAFGAA
jgi:hypothetical protein